MSDKAKNINSYIKKGGLLFFGAAVLVVVVFSFIQYLLIASQSSDSKEYDSYESETKDQKIDS